jgi:D-alanyl-D-alanine carboxypeptidase (penicillin-binding protein 5/6)
MIRPFSRFFLIGTLLFSLSVPVWAQSESATEPPNQQTRTPAVSTTTKPSTTKATSSKSKKTASKKKTTRKASQNSLVASTSSTASGTAFTRAAAVLVSDARTGRILYERNADALRSPASTQKLLTALIVVEEGNLDKRVRIQEIDTRVEPVIAGLRPGEVYTRRALLEVLMVKSCNDVARALARDNAGSIEAFADKMNARALELGMTQSNFVNPNGLTEPGQLSTARDMAKLARAAYQNLTIRSLVSIKMLNFQRPNGKVVEYKNTNRVLRGYAPCNGMKTGYTQAAGHCLISSASANGREVIVVVLGHNRQIWQDSYSLLSWGLSL